MESPPEPEWLTKAIAQYAVACPQNDLRMMALRMRYDVDTETTFRSWWAYVCDAKDREDLRYHFTNSCSRMREQVDTVAMLLRDAGPLPAWMGNPEHMARDAALAWLHRRDDLAAIADVLGAADVDTAHEREMLAEADAHAQTSGLFAGVRDERLDAVGERYPDAWWGHVSRKRVMEGRD